MKKPYSVTLPFCAKINTNFSREQEENFATMMRRLKYFVQKIFELIAKKVITEVKVQIL